jgi:hypothetical protein
MSINKIILTALLVLPSFAYSQNFMEANLSDRLAWEKVIELVTPLKNSKSNKLTFESWASDADIFSANPTWPSMDSGKKLGASFISHSRVRGTPTKEMPDPCALPQNTSLVGASASKATNFPKGACVGEEVRRNKIVFDYLVGNSLNTKRGLASAYANNKSVQMPPGSVAFKGDWATVEDVATWISSSKDDIRKNYYTTWGEQRGSKVEVALISFRLMNKEGSNWIWSDFEASKNPGRCDGGGCIDSFGAVSRVVKSNQVPHKAYPDCHKSPEVLALFKSAGVSDVWKSYCLYGSQTSYEDRNGKPTILGKGVASKLTPEEIKTNSSCITCHAYASFNAKGEANPLASSANLPNPNGKPDLSLIKGYLTYDFTWGVANAP